MARIVMPTATCTMESSEANEKEGRGTYRYASGDVYEGDYKADRREGIAARIVMPTATCW